VGATPNPGRWGQLREVPKGRNEILKQTDPEGSEQHANNMPNHWLKYGKSLAALRLTVHSNIEATFMPRKSLPYRIDHWYVHGK
jgi:hypothetical protein